MVPKTFRGHDGGRLLASVSFVMYHSFAGMRRFSTNAPKSIIVEWMNTRLLGKTGIALTELGFGCSGLFGMKVLGKDALTEEQATELIRTAAGSGIRFFDTGFSYGKAEERLGAGLQALLREGYRRDDFVIETKCGETLLPDGSYGPTDFSPDWLRRSVEMSLQRLQTDHIDLLATHGGRRQYFTGEFFALMEDLKRQGIIRAYGVSSGVDAETLEWIAAEQNFDYVMLRYNIFTQKQEEVIEKLHDAGVGVLAGASMGEGLYANRVKFGNRKDLWYLARALVHQRANMKKGKVFRFMNECPDATSNQIALRFVLDNPNVTAALFNTANPAHLRENAHASDLTMPLGMTEKIREAYEATNK